MQAYLGHVVRTVAHYRPLRAVDGSAPPLNEFPVLTRDTVAAAPASFRSSEFEADAAVFFADTNGTVRRKLRVVFDLVAWFDLNYGTYARVARQVPGLAARVVPGEAAVVLVVDNPAADPLTRVLPTLGGALLRQVVLGADEEGDRRTVRDIAAAPPALLYGKPSSLRDLGVVARRAGVPRMRPFAVLTSGENLYDDDRRHLEELFEVPVLNAYLATEGGLIGLECRYHTGLHLQEDRVWVELAGSDGNVVRHGVGEVLLTGVMNWGQAFVRYRVGDTAAIESFLCRCGYDGRSAVRLWGGDVRSYSTHAEPVDAETVTHLVVGAGVSRFQLRRLAGDRFRMMWVPPTTSASPLAATQRTLCTSLARRYPDLGFEVVPVGHITARGSKVRRFPGDPPGPAY
jgi:hypothetical protein